MLSISDSLTPIARTYPSTEALVQIAQHPGHDLGGADSTFELLPRDLLGGSVGIFVQVAGQQKAAADPVVLDDDLPGHGIFRRRFGSTSSVIVIFLQDFAASPSDCQGTATPSGPAVASSCRQISFASGIPSRA